MEFIEIKSSILNTRAFRSGELAIIIERCYDMIHLSVSHSNRIPSWEELKSIKYHFFPDLPMVMHFPKRSDYVNLHPFCMHLYSGDL